MNKYEIKYEVPLIGGSNKKIFDLSKNYKFTDDVQSNLDKIYNMFGNKFNIKYKKFILPVILVKDDTTDALKKYNVTFYTLLYDQFEKTDYLFPFRIFFIDPIKYTNKNESCITDIHRASNITGSEMVQIVLNINKKLNVQRTFIGDGAKIECNGKKYDLSLLKFIERNMSFYMKFGFKYYQDQISPNGYLTGKDRLDKMIKITRNIKDVKISDLIKEYESILDILSKVIKKQDFHNFKITLSINETNDEKINELQDKIYKKNPEESLIDLFTSCYSMLSILKNTNDKYLYKLLIKLFNDKNKCNDYGTIINEIAYTKRYEIIYGSKIIKRDYNVWFRSLYNLIHNSFLVYTF